MQSCCFGALFYPSILSHAPKALGLWLKVSGPKSVFHVAAMIAPWLKGFAWSKPTPCLQRLQEMQSSVSACFRLKFYRSFCWARRCFNRSEFLIRWRTGCLTTKKNEELLCNDALPCIAQEYSNAILEPLSLAYLLRQCFNISQQLYVLVMTVPCLKCSSALPKGIETNRLQPPHSCKIYSCQRAQGSGFFETKAVARELIWSIPMTHSFAVQRIRLWQGDWLDHALLLLRCSGLSRHCARGAKGARARLWMSAAGPESVFHVAVMLVPWFDACLWRWSLHIVFSSSARCRIRVWCQSKPLLLQFVGHGGVSMGPDFCKIVWQLCAQNQPTAINVLTRPYSLAASMLWFIPDFHPRRQRS